MQLFFDMDYTLIAADGSLRPGATELFQKLKTDGHTLYIWSGMGVRREEVRRQNLEVYVDGVYRKPISEYVKEVHKMLDRQEIPTMPDLVVDDHQEIVAALGGIVVHPFWTEDDTEMEEVYQIIRDYVANGYPGHKERRPRLERPQE
jgi:predicted HAD superfamily phosphohydrolase YqeG